MGGARMHAEISGTVDFQEKNDESCLKRLRLLVSLLPEAGTAKAKSDQNTLPEPAKNPESFYDIVSLDGQKQYDARDLLASIVDANSVDEYKGAYGKTLVTAY